MPAQPQLSLDDALSHGNALSGHPTQRSHGSERDELLTADEVADRLRMTRAWVYAETRAERIPHLRLGRYIRYRRAAIEDWIVEMESRHQPGLLARATRDPRSRFAAR